MLFVGRASAHDIEVYRGTPGPHYFSYTEVGGQQRLVQPYLKWVDAPETNENIVATITRGLDIARSIHISKCLKARYTIVGSP